MFKNKLNIYFLTEITKSYFFVLSILSLLLWMTQAARFLYLITENGIPIIDYVQYILFLFPRSVTQLMHFSFLISIFLSIIKLQNNKELEIYWISGISKKEIISLIIKISLILTIISLILYSLVTPYANGKSRKILENSQFSVINSLVKQNNFNSPLKGVTFFVLKNDNQGNLEKIFIFEKDKTIISKYGRVLSNKEKKYLELSNGMIHEKNSNKITTIKFDKTLYDFTNYEHNIITTLKAQERSLIEIFLEYKLSNNLNFLEEIHKRLIKPLFIPLIALLCCFILHSNNEKISSNKIKIFTFTFSTLVIIFIEILISISTKGSYFRLFFYLTPFLFFIVINKILIKFLNNETISSQKNTL